MTSSAMTVTCSYCATGEGSTIMALICWAESPDMAIDKFGRIFDPYFAAGADVYEGARFDLPETKYLFGEGAKKTITEIAESGKANMQLYASAHVNFS